MKTHSDISSGATDATGIVDALMTDPKRARAVRELLKDRLSKKAVRPTSVPPSVDHDVEADDLWDNVPV